MNRVPQLRPKRGRARRRVSGLLALVTLVGIRGLARAEGLPPELAKLPQSSPLVVYVPRLENLVSELEAGRRALAALDARTPPPDAAAAVARVLWGVAAERERSALPTGLDAERPAVAAFAPSLESAVLFLPLTDAGAFERWLESVPAPSRARVRLEGGGQAVVLAPDGPRPVGCVIFTERALCQIGSSGRGFEALNQHLAARARGAPGRGFAERPTLGDLPALRGAWRSLTPGASWSAVAQPVALARGLARLWARGTLHAHRFESPAVQQAIRGRARRVEALAVEKARLLEALALGVTERARGAGLELVLGLHPRGSKRLDRWIPERAVSSRIRRWVATPALASLFVQAEPEVTRALAAWAGVRLPAAALDGTLGFLAFGVDGRCPHARQSSGALFDWAFFFPSAVTLGLSGPRGADVVHARLAVHQAIPRPSVRRRPAIQARIDGGEVAVHVLDDVLLAGTGPMSGLAGLRRLEAAPSPSLHQPRGFFRAVVDLAAVDAALAAAHIGEHHRSELRALDRLRRRLSPLLHELRSVRMSGVRERDGRRVRVNLLVGD